LIKKYKLEVFNIKKLNTHGGSLRYYIKKVLNKKFDVNKKVKIQLNQELNYGINKYATYIEFKNKVESSKKKLKQILLKLKKKKQKNYWLWSNS
jgi:IS4 transposase